MGTYPRRGSVMKKVLILTAAAVWMVACSGNKKTENGTNSVYYTGSGAQSSKDAKYQIIDQEFDNMLAPESDYETLSAYELQACGDSYLPPANLKKTQKKAGSASKKTTKKASAKVTKNKKVTNNVTVHYIDGPAPVPTGKLSSSSTTTTTVSSSSSSSSGSYSTGNGAYGL